MLMSAMITRYRYSASTEAYTGLVGHVDAPSVVEAVAAVQRRLSFMTASWSVQLWKTDRRGRTTRQYADRTIHTKSPADEAVQALPAD